MAQGGRVTYYMHIFRDWKRESCSEKERGWRDSWRDTAMCRISMNFNVLTQARDMSIVSISLLSSFPPYKQSLNSFNSVIFNIFQLLYCKKNQTKISWNPLQKAFASMGHVSSSSAGQSSSQYNCWGSKALLSESTFLTKSFPCIFSHRTPCSRFLWHFSPWHTETWYNKHN